LIAAESPAAPAPTTSKSGSLDPISQRTHVLGDIREFISMKYQADHSQCLDVDCANGVQYIS